MASSQRYTAFIVVFAILGLAAFFGVAKYLTTEDQNGRRQRPPTPVIVAPVAMGEFVDRIEALGTVVANESVAITAQVTDTVREILFEDGQLVEEGALLVRLTSEQEEAELKEALATLLEANQQLERIRGLVSRGTTTRQQLDVAISARDQAAARVRAIEARLADRRIKAPFGGLLGFRRVSRGTLVTPGTVITTLDEIDPVKLDFPVPETFVGAIRVGLELTAHSDAYPDQDFKGEVTAIDTRVDTTTRSIVIRSVIPNPDNTLRPGMLMSVEVFRNRRQSMLIPEDAVVPIDETVFVFRLKEDGTIERVRIKTGGRNPGTVEVLDGLNVGDLVVVGGTNRVRDGSKVRVVETRGGDDTETPSAQGSQ